MKCRKESLKGVLAGNISDKKEFTKWKNLIRSKGIENQIRTNLNLAVSVYNTLPGKEALSYSSSLNPTAGKYISGKVAA